MAAMRTWAGEGERREEGEGEARWRAEVRREGEGVRGEEEGVYLIIQLSLPRSE